MNKNEIITGIEESIKTAHCVIITVAPLHTCELSVRLFNPLVINDRSVIIIEENNARFEINVDDFEIENDGYSTYFKKDDMLIELTIE